MPAPRLQSENNTKKEGRQASNQELRIPKVLHLNCKRDTKGTKFRYRKVFGITIVHGGALDFELVVCVRTDDRKFNIRR